MENEDKMESHPLTVIIPEILERKLFRVEEPRCGETRDIIFTVTLEVATVEAV